MEKIPQEIKNVLNDKSLNLTQKMTAFMMYMDPKMIPVNPNHEDYNELGIQIKKLIDSNAITINGFDDNFNIICKNNN